MADEREKLSLEEQYQWLKDVPELISIRGGETLYEIDVTRSFTRYAPERKICVVVGRSDSDALKRFYAAYPDWKDSRKMEIREVNSIKDLIKKAMDGLLKQGVLGDLIG